MSHELRGGVNWIHEPRLRCLQGHATQGALHAAERESQRSGDQGPGRGQRPDRELSAGAVRPLRAGRLASLEPPDAQSWRPLGLRATACRSIRAAAPNFQAMQQAGPRPAVCRDAARRFRQGAAPGSRQRAAAIWARPSICSATAATSCAADGACTRTSATSRRTCSPRRSTPRQAAFVFQAFDPTGLRKEDGSFFHVGDPLSTPSRSSIPSPADRRHRVKSCRRRSSSRTAGRRTSGGRISSMRRRVVSADYVRVDGRDLNMRVRPNVIVNGQPRVLAAVNVSPNNRLPHRAQQGQQPLRWPDPRVSAPAVAWRRRQCARTRWRKRRAMSAPRTTRSSQNLIQDIRDPFGPVQQGPSARTDSRHMISISGIVHAPWDDQVAPIFYYRSALPVHTFEGRDLNLDGTVNDRTVPSLPVHGHRRRQSRDVRGGRHLRHGELQPARGVLAAQSARQPGVCARAGPCASRRSARSSTCSTRRIRRSPSCRTA